MFMLRCSPSRASTVWRAYREHSYTPPFTADTSPRLAVLPVAKEKSVRLHSLHVGSIISNRRNIARQAQSAHNIKRDFSVRHIYFVAAHHVAAKHTRTTVPFSYLSPPLWGSRKEAPHIA